MQVVNQTIPSQEQMKEFFGSGEDGPFVMVNLLKLVFTLNADPSSSELLEKQRGLFQVDVTSLAVRTEHV